MNLNIGLTAGGKQLTLPADYVVNTFAFLAIRGAGKTCSAAVIAEELCRNNLPWVCFDPVGNWYGLRASPDGRPGGFPVVVIGGQHGDIPLEKTAGAKIADAVMSENVQVVIDLSEESKKFWHTFVTDFCLELMSLNPEVPRHLFFEEAPEWVPQRTRVDLTLRCKEAVERLIRLGRNRGYGCSLISQRPATVDKDVLSQCENLFILRTTGPHDRKAIKEWIEAKAYGKGLEKLLGEIATLDNGEAWFWSPHWMNIFEKIRFRPRMTFHPGETRTIGKAIKPAAMCDVREFTEKLKRQLAPKIVTIGKEPPGRLVKPAASYQPPAEYGIPQNDESIRLHKTIETLNTENMRLRRELEEIKKRLASVRKMLEPQYASLKALFEEMGTGPQTEMVNKEAYEVWLKKAGRAGCRRLLEILLERPELTRAQLATLGGVGMGTLKNYLGFLRRNNLVETDGEMVRLLPL